MPNRSPNSADSPSAEDPLGLTPDTAALHADKYNDPRVRFTRRGIFFGVLVVVFGIVGAAASIWIRRTDKVATRQYWGDDTVTAFELADQLHMIPIVDDAWPEVELTATPGLGHLRRALLEQSHYDWSTVAESPAVNPAAVDPDDGIRLQFEDPTGGRVPTIMIDIDLATGRIGPTGEASSVQFNERIRRGLESQLKLWRNAKQKNYDRRIKRNE